MKNNKILLLAIATVVVATSTKVVANNRDTYISQEIQKTCEKYGTEYNICPELIEAMIETESSGKPKAINGRCTGLMQVDYKFHEDRMEELGVTDLTDIDGNIHVGVDYLHELFMEYGDCGYVLDIYNGNSKADYNAEKGILSDYANKVLTRSAELEELHNK